MTTAPAKTTAPLPPQRLSPLAGGRVQLALNVTDLDASVRFYADLFGVPPAKLRPGYANFAIAQPPLKLVLIQDSQARGDGVLGALNHLGVEVPTSAAVRAATQDLRGRDVKTRTEDGVTCCHAVQDKVWVSDPDGAPWEVYTVLADSPADSATAPDVEAATAAGAKAASACCDTDTAGSCCDADAKPSCCGDQSGSALPASCSCA